MQGDQVGGNRAQTIGTQLTVGILRGSPFGYDISGRKSFERRVSVCGIGHSG